MVRTYVDSCVLIAAFHGNHRRSIEAIAVLDDPKRTWITSDYVKLETLPKPLFTGHKKEAEFMQAFFDTAHERVPSSDPLTSASVKLAAQHDLKAMDALHVSAALHGKAEQFVTLEKRRKPLGRVTELRVAFLSETS